MKNFVDMVKAYSQWKLQEKGNGKLTKSELANLREAFKAQTQGQSTNKNVLKERVDEYRAWKKSKQRY